MPGSRNVVRVRREQQQSLVQRLSQQRFGPVFDEGHLAAPDELHHGGVEIVDDDALPCSGERQRERQPDVARSADDAYIVIVLFHRAGSFAHSPPSLRLLTARKSTARFSAWSMRPSAAICNRS